MPPLVSTNPLLPIAGILPELLARLAAQPRLVLEARATGQHGM